MAKTKRKFESKSNGPTIKNRILGLKFIEPQKLQVHPKNWRRHPNAQKSILTEVLATIGMAGAGGRYLTKRIRNPGRRTIHLPYKT